ncbi:hypothetical protein CJI54_00950 [Bifidobacteriaceae bacterium NR026]|nr:hypothetical protein CJI54_00950 [Bifidobacteriaceae bacterium NR026]
MPSPIALCVIFIVILLALNTVLYFKSILDSKFLILLTTKYCSQSQTNYKSHQFLHKPLSLIDICAASYLVLCAPYLVLREV